jgi:hypothetical protein
MNHSVNQRTNRAHQAQPVGFFISIAVRLPPMPQHRKRFADLPDFGVSFADD